MRIAVDEIHAFLLHSDMLIYLVVFDEKATRMGKNLYPELEAYIDLNATSRKDVKKNMVTLITHLLLPEEIGERTVSCSDPISRGTARRRLLSEKQVMPHLHLIASRLTFAAGGS